MHKNPLLISGLYSCITGDVGVYYNAICFSVIILRRLIRP